MTEEGKGLTLLVVEDNSFQRAIAVKVLEDLGCDAVLSAEDGDAALRAIVAHPSPIHVVLSDLDMPGMDGVEFLRHIAERQLAETVVIASALDSALIHTVEDMVLEHGLQVLTNVEKPVTREKMRNVIAQYREKQREKNPGSWASTLTLAEIQEGLDKEQFEVWLQPKVRISDGAWVSSEALARWAHPKLGTVMPAQFVPQMEKSGIIDRLTWGQIHKIVEQLRDWQREGRDLSIAVNFSPVLLEDLEMPRKLEEILSHYGVSPCRLTLELTENVVMKNLARSLETLARLRIKGFMLSIDDFGTGFSNLQQLNRIPFSELKIDQTFVRSLHGRASSRAIVESNITLANRLQLKTVAEGIETPEEWFALHGMKCDLAQGFLIGRPMPVEKLASWELDWLSRYQSDLKP